MKTQLRKTAKTVTKRAPRIELFAFMANEYTREIKFSRHFSRLAAERFYGDLGRLYRGNPWTDYRLTVITREELLETFSDGYVIDFEQKTISPKTGGHQ